MKKKKMGSWKVVCGRERGGRKRTAGGISKTTGELSFEGGQLSRIGASAFAISILSNTTIPAKQ
jgi:hypothetical protein